MLKEKQALVLLKVQLEEREYWSCRKFRHLVHNYRTKKEKEKKKKEKPQNKYRILATRIMQCKVKGKVEVK